MMKTLPPWFPALASLLTGLVAGAGASQVAASPVVCPAPVVCPTCVECPEAVVDPLPVLPITPSVAE